MQRSEAAMGEMTGGGGGGGGGRRQWRRKTMYGGRGTTETKIDINTNNNECPNSNFEFTEMPPGFPNITKLPQTSTTELDFYTHARKALSFCPPFLSDESQTSLASVSGANDLPNGLKHLLSRHSDGRKRHKRPHSGTEKKSSAPRQTRAGILWTETDEYFRELTIEDIERLEDVSVGFYGNEKCFMIPCMDNDDSVRRRYDALNGLLMRFRDNDDSSITNLNELNRNGMVKEMLVKEENEQDSMDVDGDEGENVNLLIKDENNGKKRENDEKQFSSFSGVEWLLGSRNKIYLASERPSKKRKLLGRDAGLEKLLVARPVAELDSNCHYCSYGENGDPLNCLIKCSSCGMVVHQRCYGVEEEVNSYWLCSWCKCKDSVVLTSERPCLLCPKQGGALKPVCKAGFGSDNESSEVEFAHLFCCQWIPEVYLENIRSMEPIMNLDKLKNVRRKSVCTLCKVKCGACVWCSNGACRTSFHPICAREATYRMEIWGKLGCDEVELRAYCSKHSEVQHDSSSQNAEDVSSAGDSVSHVSKQRQMVSTVNDSHKLKITQTNGDKIAVDTETVDMDLSKLDDILMDKEVLLDNNGPSSGPYHVDKEAVDRNDNEDVNAHGALNFTLILKKLIDMRNVDVKDVALEIGVAPGSLNSILTDNHMAPEIQCKIAKWLKDHTHIVSLHKNLKLKIKPIVIPDAAADVAEGASSVSVEKCDIADAVPVKYVPLRRRTKGNMRISGDEKSGPCKEKIDLTTEQGGDMCVRGGEDLNGPPGEFLPGVTKVVIDPVLHEDSSLSEPLKIGDEMSSDLSQCHGLAREIKKSEQMPTHSLLLTNGEFMAGSYVHPFICSKLLQTENGMLGKTVDYDSSDLTDREVSQFEASSSSGHCCHNHSLRATSGGGLSESDRESLDQLVKARNLSVLKLSPEDEVEGELIYYQQRLLSNAVTKKRLCDDVVMKVVRSLPQDLDVVGNKKWDAVSVCQYNHELRETKKQGRKERRHREAQAVLAAATAAAAASSRMSSFRKDTLEESAHQEELLKMNAFDLRPGVYSQLNPRVEETLSMSTVSRSSLDTCDTSNLASDISKELPRTCDICRRSETILNPILVCSSCKVTVHLDCYCSIKSSSGPWHCELCEELFSSQGPGAPTTYSLEKPFLIAECVLCGGTAGAFRKSVDGQWVHALCAEWVLEETYRRGQVNPLQRMETVCKGVDSCIVCSRKQGVCLKCSYGHCQTTFHPTCARSAGFHMTVHTVGGKLQHKAYCETHSAEQKAKADTQRHGVEELKSLKQLRVELERLRLLCERIIKREKLKRELVTCSHHILASSRDSVLSALARHPFYQPEISSESATTSIQGYTDGYKSGSEIVQRSDDITVDSTVAGKRRIKISISMDNQRPAYSSASQNLNLPKAMERVSVSGKQIPQRHSIVPWNPSDDVEKHSKYNKHTETFEKELVMTSDQASMKNQRLPKGFVYVPVQCLSKDKETVPDASSGEPMERNV